MPQLNAVRNDVLSSTLIELERVFTVLSNAYDHAKFPKHALLLTTVENRLRKCLNEMKQTDFDSHSEVHSNGLLQR